MAKQTNSGFANQMSTGERKWSLWAELVSAWVILLILIFYTYQELVVAPYIGFNFIPTDGTIAAVYTNLSTYDLQVGDRLRSVNGVNIEQWGDDLGSPLLALPLAPQPLALDIETQQGVQKIEWPLPGYNQPEWQARLLSSSLWLGYFFWSVGLATLLLVRPLDAKRRLFAAFCMLTALWLVVGNTSRWGYSDSRIVYRVIFWLSVPVLLHLHWLFPRPLGRLPATLVWAVYGATLLVALLQWTPLIPAEASALAYALALLGTLLLLVIHYLRQPDVRANLRLLLFAFLFAVLPVAGIALAFVFGVVPVGAEFSLFALPVIPGAYFYSIYRFQLGGSEFRANRLIALYLFLIMLGTGITVVLSVLGEQPPLSGQSAFVSLLIGLAIVLISIFGFPRFQRLVERRLLGMPLPPLQLIETYLARITTTLNQGSLVQLLKDEVLPSLLVRESALYRVISNEAIPVYNTGDDLSAAVLAELIAHLKHHTLYRAPALSENSSTNWVRLGLALQVEGKVIGLWLLGRHDPDDLYSQAEVATLQTLAHQTALALANIEQATQLQALYQANIERQEQEHIRMAHFLHDAILNQAAALYMSLDAASLTANVSNAYETLKEQIHHMISSLRPPSLDLGLDAALEEMAGELEQRIHSTFLLRLHVPRAGVHYPSHVEHHIFRIVQQACENAIRHAHAQKIQVTGALAPTSVELTIEDDGVGFAVEKPIDMARLLAHKHFGLVHMMERAESIGAELAFESAPGQGTRIKLRWTGSGSAQTTSGLSLQP